MLNLGQNLSLETIEVDRLYLDPNNLRFLDFEEEVGIVRDDRIPETGAQSRAFEKLNHYQLKLVGCFAAD
jgi:hypothetical protein